jgi:two-component system, sensor histidine kinase YesM
MKKMNFLSTRIIIAWIALFALALLSILIGLIAGYLYGFLYPAVLWSIVLLGLLICVLVYVYLFIRRPYRETCRQQRAFLSEQIYNELFQPPVPLTPEVQQVMERFRYLLSQQEIVSLSKKQAEYLALQNQINPHFLYNTLEAIRGDALIAGQEDIAKTAEALAAYFRYTITEMGDLVTVEDELNNIDSYFIIQRYRFDDKLRLEVVADEEIVYRCKIPKLTLQPIVENAIFHGLERKSGGGLISILLQTTKKRIVITIKDDGVGMPQEKVNLISQKLEKVKVGYISDEKRAKGGIALRNVAQRIKLLFGEEYGLQLYSTEGVGTEVVINLPKLTRGGDE